MRKLLAVLLAFLSLFTLAGVSAAEAVPDNLALLKLGSAAEGSTVNYVVLRTVMGYCNEEGLCVGTMFEGVVLSHPDGTDTPEKAEAFLTDLTGKNGVFPSAEQAANDLVENGFAKEEEVYPLYVSFPNVNDAFSSAKERDDFCTYYVDTLTIAFESGDYTYIRLAGVYFDESYDRDKSFRNECISLVKAKGLATLAATVGDTPIDADMVYACNPKFEDRLGTFEDGGVVMSLEGVPDDSNDSHLRALLSDGIRLEEFDGDTPTLYTFEAFNNLYDCAIAISQDVPNKNGRAAYDCIKNYIDGDFETPRKVYEDLGGEKATTTVIENSKEQGFSTEMAVVIGICVLGLGAIAYILISSRKAKK